MPLSANGLLQESVNPLSEDGNHGINLYVVVIEVLQEATS